MSVKSYKDLVVWQEARRLVKMIYQLTDTFPTKEQYALTQQIRRAVVSIPSNIAEGHSRHSKKDYINFLSIAIGSLAELDTQIILSCDLGYVTEKNATPVFSAIHGLQRMLHSLRTKLKSPPLIPNPQSLVPVS